MSRTDAESRPTAEDASEPSERSPFSFAWMLSLGVIVVVLLAAATIIVVVRTGGAGVDPPPVVELTTAPVSTPPSASAEAPFVPCAPVDQAKGNPLVEAPDAQWDLVDTLALPTTAGGPGKVEGNLATCYSPDTLGALTAAVQIYLRANVTGGETVREQQTTPDSQLRSDEALREWETNPRTKPWPQLRAFQIGTIENNRVDTALQLKSADGQVTPIFRFEMVWSGTDWLLGAAYDQSSYDDAGMILWEGV